MTGIVIFIHLITCILVVTVIMMQSGRGGGLAESFASAEAMFGVKTNEFMVKSTTVLAVVFLVTSLSLAYVSARADRSMMASQDAVDLEKVLGDIPVVDTIEIPAGATSPEAQPLKDATTPVSDTTH